MRLVTRLLSACATGRILAPLAAAALLVLALPQLVRAQSPSLQSPSRVTASAGEALEFVIEVAGLPQSAAAGSRYDQLRFAFTAVGSVAIDPAALDSTTGRFRYTPPCSEAGKSVTLVFKLLNAGTLLATSSTELRISKDLPEITATYPELLLLNPEQPTSFDIALNTVCGGSARLEPLPNGKGVAVAVAGSYPTYRITLNARSLKAGEVLELPFRASDGGNTKRFSINASVDNTPRPPYFERDLPRRIEVFEDEERPIRIRAYDPNNENVRYTIKNLTELKGQANITDRQDGILTWKSRPEALDPDRDRTEYTLVIEASDGKDAVTETFAVTVLRKVTIAQRQQRLRRYNDEFQRLNRLRNEARAFYAVVNRRADRRSNGELYRILAKSMFSILAAVSATIEHQQTRVIAVSSATVLVAGVDLVSNRRRKYDPFEDLRAVRELVRNLTVALSDRRYRFTDPELGDINRLAQGDDIIKITRELATDCDRFDIELQLLKDRYKSTVKPIINLGD